MELYSTEIHEVVAREISEAIYNVSQGNVQTSVELQINPKLVIRIEHTGSMRMGKILKLSFRDGKISDNAIVEEHGG